MKQGKSRRLSGGLALKALPKGMSADQALAAKKTESAVAPKANRLSAKARRRSFGRLSIGAGAGDENSPPVADASQVVDMYAQVIKLSAENKISTKNTWSLSLIDHIDQVIEPGEQRDKGGEAQEATNFQKASCTLDASVKIYSCRVDDAHKSSLRVLENLNRTDAKKKEEDEEDERKGERKTTRASRKAGVASTLESNPAAITVSSFDQGVRMDPTFKKLSLVFESAGARGMLLSNLQVGNGCAVALDGETGGNGELEQATEDDEEKDEKDEKDEGEKEEEEEGGSTPAEPGAKASARSEDGEQQLDVADLRSALGSLQTEFTQLSLCPALPDMYAQAEGAVNGEDEMTVAVVNATVADMTAAAAAADATTMDCTLADGGDIGADTTLFGGDGDSFCDDGPILGDLTDHEEAEGEGFTVAASGPAESTVSDGADPATSARVAAVEAVLLESAGSDYSYFDREKLDNWAGPEHWKFARPTRRRAAQQKQQQHLDEDAEGSEAEGAVSGKARRGRKAGFTVDFAAPPVDPRKAFAPPPRAKTATVLTEASLKKAERAGSSAHLLPEDLHYKIDSLLALALAPRAGVRKLRLALPGVDAGDGVPSSDLLHPAPMLHATPAEEGAAETPAFVPYGAVRAYGELLAARTGGPAPAGEGAPAGAIGLSGSGLDSTVCFTSPMGAAAADDTFVGGMGGGEDFDDYDDDGGDDGFMPPQTPGGTASHGLVDQPATVAEARIGFTKRAKRVDVRRLKRELWDELSAAVMPRSKEGDSEEGGEQGEGTPASFQETVAHMAPRMPSNVTVPFYFICALHLANEHGLALESQGMGDFVIAADA